MKLTMVANGSQKKEENVKLDAAKSKESTLLTEEKLYSSDIFRMFCYKVLPCTKVYNHNWKTCPFLHEGEKAGRRDPQKYRYAGIECHEAKEGAECPRGNDCPYAHNLFEFWLHPTRYRTQLCNKPATCRRKVCFFAHNVEELRHPSENFQILEDSSQGGSSSDTRSSSSCEIDFESANNSVLGSEKDGGGFTHQVSPLSTLDLESSLTSGAQSVPFLDGSFDASGVSGVLSADFSASSRASSRCSPVPLKGPAMKLLHCSPSMVAPGGDHLLPRVSSVQIPAYRCNSSEHGLGSDLSVPLDFPLETSFPTLSGSFFEEFSDTEFGIYTTPQRLYLSSDYQGRACSS